MKPGDIVREGSVVRRRAADGHVMRAECTSVADAIAFERILRDAAARDAAKASPPAKAAPCDCKRCGSAEYAG